jgi:hypothetical protein
MKNTLRAFLICIALIMCLMPALIACDSQQTAEGGSEETTQGQNQDQNQDVVFEGTPISKNDNISKTMVVKLHRLGEPDATTGNVKCSLVLYDSEGNVMNYVVFDYVGGGKAPNVLTLDNVVWDDTHLTAHIANGDGSKQSFDISYAK